MCKSCSKCSIEKPLTEFYKRKALKDGYRSECKACTRIYQELKKEEIVQYRKEYRTTNQEQIKAYRDSRRSKDLILKKEWYQANKERLKPLYAEYASANSDKIKEYQKGYQRDNRAKIRAISARRRASKIQATPSWADKKKTEHVYWVCNFISELTGIPHEVDHIHPLQGKEICGLHVHTNLQILTTEENRKKSNTYKVDV